VSGLDRENSNGASAWSPAFKQDGYWLNPAGQDRVMSRAGVSQLAIHKKTSGAQYCELLIQNASGQPKLGDRVAEYLKERG